MRKMHRFILSLFVAATAQLAAAQPATGPIMIGSSILMTGGVSTFGQHSRWGSELAMAEANAAGGVLGRKIEIDFQDNRCNPAEAVKSVTQMIADKKYVALLDGLCSSVALAIMPLVERAEIPFVVANASATAIAEKSGVGGNKWTFKVNPTDASMRDALAKTKYPSILGTTLELDANNLVHNNAVILGIKDGQVVVFGYSKT